MGSSGAGVPVRPARGAGAALGCGAGAALPLPQVPSRPGRPAGAQRRAAAAGRSPGGEGETRGAVRGRDCLDGLEKSLQRRAGGRCNARAARPRRSPRLAPPAPALAPALPLFFRAWLQTFPAALPCVREPRAQR